jgi:tetratricopeptide (TPR) repeat protein
VLPDERALIERALRSRSRDEALALIAPLRARITQDSEVAEAWLTLLEATPGRDGLVDDVRAALGAFPTDLPLLFAGLRTLLRADERRGPDEPAMADAPARVALELGEPVVASVMGPGDRAVLSALLGNAHRRLGPRHDAQAIELLESAAKLSPRDGSVFFDLGLCHKWAGRFRAAALAFARAEERLGPKRAVLFNRATVATACGDVADAADGWRRLGFRVETSPDALPLVHDEDGALLREVLVRVPTRGTGHSGVAVPDAAIAFELLGVAPLSPCHGVVRTPTARAAIVDFGDVVLFDPAPVGRVAAADGQRPVLPLLHVIQRGDEKRFGFLALEQNVGDVERLGRSLPEGCVWYLHDTRVDRVCPRCAAGETFLPHTHEAPTERRVVRGKLVVPSSVSLTEVRAGLELTKDGAVLLAIPGLHEALGDTPTAGKHHKSWGVIERGLLAPSTAAPSRA